jgi:hypothetical protein
LTAGKPIVGQIKKRESLGIDRDQCHVVIGIHIDYFGGKVAIGLRWTPIVGQFPGKNKVVDVLRLFVVLFLPFEII